ncbi:hypothetical protein, partial [Clostridioides difficile]|uniref:hypothetical protein n=1 Tax=Clostridioides difficile TaxID=1496 RepID=UPI001143B320
KSIKLAEKLGNNYEKARLDVDLASIFLKIGSYETGDKLINYLFKIDIYERLIRKIFRGKIRKKDTYLII